MSKLESTKKSNSILSIGSIRFLFQIFFFLAIMVTGYRYATGRTLTSVETFCPFGGLETALSLFTAKQFSCVTGERNLALFIALLALTFITRKSFCSWVCPVGAISEWLWRVQTGVVQTKRRTKLLLKQWQPSPKLDLYLRWLRLPMLVAILFFTFKTGELIFKGFDPFYILFSFNGHDVKAWSYLVLAVFFVGIIIVPMAWCRYLCPLGIALWPFSKLGRIRVVRNETACNSCRKCDKKCPHSIPVSQVAHVRSGECTLCLECLEVCPEKSALELRVEGTNL